MRDRSLDEFLGTGTDDEGEDPASTDPDDAVGGADPDDGADSPEGTPTDEGAAESATEVEPATVTCRHPAEPTACPVCERTVTTLWRDDGTFVCSRCKNW